jgi:hypothetical protein
MRKTMVMVRRLVLLAFATGGLLVVATEPAHALCTPNCCPWNAVQAAASAPGELPPGKAAPQYCSLQHCEPVLRH